VPWTGCQPRAVAPHRAATALCNLARGRALLVGRRQVCREDLELVNHVALSSASAEQGILLHALLHGTDVVTITW
jgi:hypothetical protein